MVRKRFQFTSQERKELEANKYVKSVSDVNISFTDEFRDYFVKRYYEGVRVPQIFAECGFDTTVLGKARMHGFRARTIGTVSGYKHNKLNDLQAQIDDLKKRVVQLECMLSHVARNSRVKE